MSEPKSTASTAPRWAAAWVVSGRCVGIAATLTANVLAARVLGPEEYGRYLLLITVVALSSIVAMGGLNEAGLRFVAEALALEKHPLARAYLRKLVWLAARCSGAAVILVVATVALFPGILINLDRPMLMVLLVVLGVLALAWQQIAAELLRGWHELRLASLFSGGQTGGPLSNLLFLAGLLACAVWAAPLSSALALGLTVASIWATLPLAIGGLWRVSGGLLPAVGDDDESARLSTDQSLQLVRVAGTLLAIQLLGFATYQLDIWIGGALLKPQELGLYGVAKRSLLLAQLPVQMAMYAVLATVPRLHTQGKIQELQKLVRTAATGAAVPALAAIALLTLFPGPIVRLVFGDSYGAAAPVIVLLAIGALALVLLGNPTYVLLMTGGQRTVLAVNALAAVLLVVGGACGAWFGGLLGLAVGSSISLVFQNVLLWWLVRRRLNVWTHVGLPWRLAKFPLPSPDTKSAAESESPAPLPYADGKPIPVKL